MTIDKKDIVSFWIYRTMKQLKDSDDGHKYMVYRLLEVIDVNKYQNKAPTLAGAIMSLAFDHSPTKHKYNMDSKAWRIMYAMDHQAIYDQIRRVQRKLVKEYKAQIESIAGGYVPNA